MLEILRKRNPRLALYGVNGPEFAEYGRVVADADFSGLVRQAEEIPMPPEGSRYETSSASLEGCPEKEYLQNEAFGGLPVQIGYCWGYNSMLNALEWHKSPEINIAVTPMVLLLGRVQDIKNGIYSSGKVKAFYLKAGDAVEVYAATLHFCPCQTEKSGFGCIVVLPQGTNTGLESQSRDPLLFRKNKWLIAHRENRALIGRGAVPGITGENYQVRY